MTLLGKLKKSNDDFSYASVYLKIHLKKIILVLQKKREMLGGWHPLKITVRIYVYVYMTLK